MIQISSISGNVTVNDIHDNKVVYVNAPEGQVQTLVQAPAADAPVLTTELLGEAAGRVQEYVWGNAAYAVLFCVCRDVYGWQDNASYFERQLSLAGIDIPAGTVNAAISRNPYMRMHVGKWDGNGVIERVLKLRDNFEKQADALMPKV